MVYDHDHRRWFVFASNNCFCPFSLFHRYRENLLGQCRRVLDDVYAGAAQVPADSEDVRLLAGYYSLTAVQDAARKTRRSSNADRFSAPAGGLQEGAFRTSSSRGHTITTCGPRAFHGKKISQDRSRGRRTTTSRGLSQRGTRSSRSRIERTALDPRIGGTERAADRRIRAADRRSRSSLPRGASAFVPPGVFVRREEPAGVLVGKGDPQDHRGHHHQEDHLHSSHSISPDYGAFVENAEDHCSAYNYSPQSSCGGSSSTTSSFMNRCRGLIREAGRVSDGHFLRLFQDEERVLRGGLAGESSSSSPSPMSGASGSYGPLSDGGASLRGQPP